MFMCIINCSDRTHREKYDSPIIHLEQGDYKALLDDKDTETTFFASKPVEKWNFEIANRSKKEIRVILKVGMLTILNKVLTARKLPTQTPKIRAALPQTINIDLIIETLEDGGTKKIVRRFNQGKKIFLNYDNGTVYPQEGLANPLLNMQRTTKSGLPLDNSVTTGEIIIVDQE
jgi:ABC-type transport system substrate-binding protein